MAQASDLQSYLVESVNGAATIKAMCAEKTTLHNFEKYQMRTVNTSWAANKLQVFQEMFSELIKQLSNIILFWVGSYLVIKGNMSIGTLISFTALAGYFINPIERIINLQSELQSAFVAARRLGEILELNTEQSKEEKYLCPQKLYGNIEFRNVAFNYGTREQVYRDLSFIINKGEKVAFVGTSGCGKTTIVKLLLKLYQANKGSILLDGNDIKDIDSGTLRMHIGYVPQDIYLFSGTIAENIALHSPCVTLEDITLAAKKAGAADFIERLPNRYATQIGERGLSLSGGERQRLALARALLGKPDILILDEATSNLDIVSENYIQQTIKDLQNEGMTIIIIAHRLSTVTDCDKIFVIEKGRVIQSGKHLELITHEGPYHDMCQNIAV